MAVLPDTLQRALERLLAAENLTGLVAPRLPLDLTPMARMPVFLKAAELLMKSDATALVIGLVPFTRNLATEAAPAAEFARDLAAIARAAGKPAGIVVDAGGDYEDFRAALALAGLPVFTRVEEAIGGLHVLA
jgi:acyl-CoA synthetase (NDP forming)